jgi:hypothetical protein
MLMAPQRRGSVDRIVMCSCICQNVMGTAGFHSEWVYRSTRCFICANGIRLFRILEGHGKAVEKVICYYLDLPNFWAVKTNLEKDNPIILCQRKGDGVSEINVGLKTREPTIAITVTKQKYVRK